MSRLFARVIIVLLIIVFSCLAIIVFMIAAELRGAREEYVSEVRDIIPEIIQTEKVLVNDFDFALPGGWCHGLVLKVSEKTLSDINDKGLLFFKNHVPEKTMYETGNNYWKEWLGFPSTSKYEGTETPNGCLNGFEKFKRKKGYAIRRDTKKYVTYLEHRGYSNISVYPEWGIVVYASWAN